MLIFYPFPQNHHEYSEEEETKANYPAELTCKSIGDREVAGV